MPLEERIVAWSKSPRPAWQRIVLREVALGSPMSREALGQMVDAMVAGDSIGDADLELEQLTTSAAQAPPVSLHSISEPTHVNALSSTKPLTFPQRGLTVVYGDNGSGKSGYARLLKRITRSRHNEDVLSDVFRATAVDRPGANLAVHVGDRLVDAIWPETNLPEFQSMLFYDSSCGSAYIADEADFPYRPYALFVMDGLIEACHVVSALVRKSPGRSPPPHFILADNWCRATGITSTGASRSASEPEPERLRASSALASPASPIIGTVKITRVPRPWPPLSARMRPPPSASSDTAPTPWPTGSRHVRTSSPRTVAPTRSCSPSTGTRSDSSTEPRKPRLFPNWSGSTYQAWAGRHGLLRKSQASVS